MTSGPRGFRSIPWESIAQFLGAGVAIGAWVAVVGGARVWARLHAAKVPATQTLALLPRQLLIVEGFQALLVPLLIGGALAAIAYFVVREGPGGEAVEADNRSAATLVWLPTTATGSTETREANVPLVAVLVFFGLLALMLIIVQVDWRIVAVGALVVTVVTAVVDWKGGRRFAVAAMIVGLLVTSGIAMFFVVHASYLFAMLLLTALLSWLLLALVPGGSPARVAWTLFTALALWSGALGFLRLAGEKHPKLDVAAVGRRGGDVVRGYYLGGAGGDVYLASFRVPRKVTRIAKGDVTSLEFGGLQKVDLAGRGSVTLAVAGAGTVRSNPRRLSCPPRCSARFAAGRAIWLTATAARSFEGWSGACHGKEPACTIKLAVGESKPVAATFSPPKPPPAGKGSLTLSISGDGTVTSADGKLSCPPLCSRTLPSGSTVRLTATAGGGTVFSGWSGACGGTSPVCTVGLASGEAQAAATFAPLAPPQPGHGRVTLAIVGNGSVTSVPTGLSCPGTCTATFGAGASVQLTATPRSGNAFKGWSGACGGTSAVCTVGLAAGDSKSATAVFSIAVPPPPPPPPSGRGRLTIAVAGNGSVASAPSGLSCRPRCVATFAAGTTVELTATAGPGSAFNGWSGACGGNARVCRVGLGSGDAKSASASFRSAPPPREGASLTIGVTGSGSVTSSPSGLSCPSTCGASFAAGTTVRLTATAGASSTFAGWSGACRGDGRVCIVGLGHGESQSAAAAFSSVSPPPPPPPSRATLGLSVSRGGHVRSTPHALSCPPTCVATFHAPATVHLAAVPSTTSRFRSWSRGCVGRGRSCTVELAPGDATIVGARFVARPRVQKPTVILPSVFFDFGKAELTRDAHRRLRQAAKLIREHRVKAIRLAGHADAVGDAAFNFELSSRRAHTVTKAIRAILRGAAPRICVVAYGEARPIAPNIYPRGTDDPGGRRRNRRVDIAVVASCPAATGRPGR